jgi:hypothetical protein
LVHFPYPDHSVTIALGRPQRAHARGTDHHDSFEQGVNDLFMPDRQLMVKDAVN